MRSAMWSPTRSAFATIVKVGFIAPIDGMKAAVYHVQVVQVVGLAVQVEDRSGRVDPEARRAGLVGGGGGVE